MRRGTEKTVWEGLPERQKLALTAVGGWFGAWLVAKLCDLASARFGLGWLSAVAQLIVTYLLNWTVAGVLIGGVAVAFGPNAWGWLRANWKELPGALMGLLFIGGVGFGVWTLGSMIYSRIADTPRRFSPPVYALKNADGTQRIFTTKTPSQILGPFDDDTKIRAKQLMASEVGKWIAITAPIYNVSQDFGDMPPNVLLGGQTRYGASLTFRDKWIGRVTNLPKGTRIYAICTIREADQYLLSLEKCELASL